jgi:hypothetical protein
VCHRLSVITGKFRVYTSDGANMLLQGVDPGFHNVPLHHINLKSHFVSGQVVVGIRHTLPVEDISLLFGIDMAVTNPVWHQ